MPHPIMFAEDDPVLVRLRAVAATFPESVEVVAHGRPTFRCGRIYCYYGGSVRGGPRMDHAILVRPDPDEAAALATDERVFVPAYVGASGWLGLDLSVDPDWTEVAELLDASYRRIAPARLVRMLDER